MNSKYDEEYFFILKNDDNARLPTLKADKNTAARNFYYQPIPTGSAPLIFFNGYREEFREDGVADDAVDILFAGANFAVRDPIRERLLTFNIPHITMHPAVYIDDRDTWHEDFWFVAFDRRFDCWDRARSEYDPDPLEIGGHKMYSIYQYVLDDRVLDATPLEQRLLFQMGGTDDELVLCHRSLAPIFRQEGASGAVLKPVRDDQSDGTGYG
jgi:hypothetical protein